MEDAHIAKLNFMDDPDMHLFGVFDGHGGYLMNLMNKKIILKRKRSSGLLQRKF